VNARPGRSIATEAPVSASLTELRRESAAASNIPATLPRTPYLSHTMAGDTAPAAAVRLRMHGEIRLKRWTPFRAEEVIHRDRGFFGKPGSAE